MKRSEQIAEGERAIGRAFPALRPLIRSHGPCPLRVRRKAGDFDALASSIVYQQLTGKVGDILYGRVLELCGTDVLEPAAVAVVRRSKLRNAGLSNAKTDTMLGLARAALDRSIAFDDLRTLPDDEIIREVTQVKGVGPWTAQMFLMFQLGRLDVWPVTDYGVQKGMTTLLGRKELIKPRQLEPVGDALRPYRSVLAWYAWRVVDTSLPKASAK